MLTSLLRVHCVRKRRKVLTTTLTRIAGEFEATIANVSNNITLISARLRNLSLILRIEVSLLRIRNTGQVNKSLKHGVRLLRLSSNTATGNAGNFNQKGWKLNSHYVAP
ncbi:hypothetical protein ALO63_200046 [Pseudomonas amygdali pv. mori]|uniref:Conjugal transfer protein n=1 Tax=Pseudomonas amygdali pv. mori TaxID=34065 RepID=A0A0N8S7P3_PSEA0|nr:hypothetical protein ALO63_200046 [Pseudomonas amygdali pv. mori]